MSLLESRHIKVKGGGNKDEDKEEYGEKKKKTEHFISVKLLRFLEC